jgi:arginyl-tRNA synthetase
MNLRNKIKDIVKLSIIELEKKAIFSNLDISEIQILKPKNDNNGDYSLNIAMEIAKIEKADPMAIAQELRQEIEKSSEFKDIFSRIDVVLPGFINLYLSYEYILKQTNLILQERNNFGSLEIGKGKKIQVEFVSANPTGPLTVGNGRGGPFGDALANVLKKAGYEIEKAYYVNDYGNQILSLGHSVMKDADAKYTGEYINRLSKEFKDETDVYLIGKKSAKIVLDEYIKKTTDSLNIEYDEWFSETILHKEGLVDTTIKYLIDNGFTYEKDGAIWLKTSEHGDERDRVIVKSDKSKTYLAGDLAYHRYKFIEKKFDKVINVWGSDHFGDVPGMMAGIEMLGFKKDRLNIVLLQFVTVMKDGKPVKMSKRLGTAITMDDLLEELSGDVIRFFFLQKSSNTHLNFDMNLAKEQSDKNPVFYVQYAHARICSVLKSGNIERKNIKNINKAELLIHEKELDLMRKMLKYSEVIEDTANDYQVHRLPQYALELASAFHQFYNECHCLVEDKDLREARLGLLMATKIVLENILSVMGISAPEKM